MLEIDQLPINAVLQELKDALMGSKTVVLSAPPGSGKTTLVPLELLAEPWLAGNKILMLEPRRLAARACALRMSQLLSEKLGRKVGYRVRFDNRTSKQTRIEVVTEGILIRQLQRDPELDGVSLVIFDEFHLRSIHADLALALCSDINAGLRDDLRMLVMSATLNTDAVTSLLDATVVTGQGRSYPVEHHYLDRAPTGSIAQMTASGIQRAIKRERGDILAFLPGTGEIREVVRLLSEPFGEEIYICPLYGDLTKDEQDHAIQPSTERLRRVVLATSIAETSLTIEGISTVVDSGWSRIPQYNPNSGLTRLETIRVSRASADQRAGRAGRLGPGVCYRLWTQANQTKLSPHTPPEIMNSDLAPLALELANWGVNDPTELLWLDPPPRGAYAQAIQLLTELEALDSKGRITAAGRYMVNLSLHPRLAHMLTYAAASGQLPLAADIAALLSERDLLQRRQGNLPLPVYIKDRLEILRLWREDKKSVLSHEEIHTSTCVQVDKAARQLARIVNPKTPFIECEPLSIGGLLSLAFPDRIARRRSSGGYRLAGGRAALLPNADRLETEEFLVICSLDAGKRDGRIFLAAPITLTEIRTIHSAAISVKTAVTWDTNTGSVIAQEQEHLGEIILSTKRLKAVRPELQQQALLKGIRQMGLGVLPWNRESKEWLQRLRCLRHWQPDADWPDVSDEALLAEMEQWLAPWLDGITKKDQLKRLQLPSILKNQLDWDRQRRMDELAPTHIQVPSGSRKRLDYSEVDAPVLAVRLQEMFGLADTPRVCGGAVAVTLHLLSPAQRPIQVTQDLQGFWKRTYQEVKKELKGRYPKHYWPDDPWGAVATSRIRPKN